MEHSMNGSSRANSAPSSGVLTFPWSDEHLQAWEALPSATVFGRPFWCECVARHLFDGAKARLLLERDERATVALSLLPATRWSSPWRTPFHQDFPMVDFAYQGDPAQAAATLLRRLSRHCPAVEFAALCPQVQPCAAAILKLAAEKRWTLQRGELTGNAHFDLTRGWEALRASLPEKVLLEAERKEQRMQRQLGGTFEEVANSPQLDAIIQECLDVDQASWKGRENIAMADVEQLGSFYRDLAHQAAARGALALYTLRTTGRLVAFLYCLKYAGRIEALKTSFDPSFARHSPGTLLHLIAMRHEAQAGRQRVFDWGRINRWKTAWNPEISTVVKATIYFPGWRGRLAAAFGPMGRSRMARTLGISRIAESIRRRQRARRHAAQVDAKREVRLAARVDDEE